MSLVEPRAGHGDGAEDTIMPNIWDLPEDIEMAARSVGYLVSRGLSAEEAADAVAREFGLGPDKRAGLLASA